MNSVLSLFSNAAQPDPGKLAADLLEKFQDVKNEFEEDRQKAAAELGPAEIAKLAPLLGEIERSIMLSVKLAEIQVEAIEGARNKSIDEASLAALAEEMRNLTGEILSANQGQRDAFKMLEGATVKFVRRLNNESALSEGSLTIPVLPVPLNFWFLALDIYTYTCILIP